jgi:hypothetical protein
MCQVLGIQRLNTGSLASRCSRNKKGDRQGAPVSWEMHHEKRVYNRSASDWGVIKPVYTASRTMYVKEAVTPRQGFKE